MIPLLFSVFGRKYRDFAEFKKRGLSMTMEEFSAAYRRTADVSEIQGETDLNETCTEAILSHIGGGTVLEAGCGRGYLARRVVEVAERVVACDIVVKESLRESKAIQYDEANLESLPYADDEFNTVVCTHTLEHVQRIHPALAELRRVARNRLIIVVPRERPYRYSFNLHLHFFPYPWSWEAVAGVVPGSKLLDLGDWFYVEDNPRN